jgi:hypothetical protein
MRFERVLENGRLWAVMYDEDCVNILEKVFTQWNDYEWLREFFTKHVDDLATFFHITDIDRAVFDTVDDANELECLIMDLNPDADLDELFRPLESGRYIITGGAIKLTATMQEREHTLMELAKLNKVRDYLISIGIFDYNGFEDYHESDD